MPYHGYSSDVLFDWLIGGVDFDLEGNGGPVCFGFSEIGRLLFESILGLLIGTIVVRWAVKARSTLPEVPTERRGETGQYGRMFLLSIVSLVFGMEMAYKFATKTVIFLLNPCHVIVAIQIYLLAAKPSKFVTGLFRIHLNFLNGALLTLLFPVTNTLFLPFETEIYFMEHVLMLVIPFYLIRIGGAYTVENVMDLSWTFIGYGIMVLYHFLILMPIAVYLQVNLSQTLCPAISDPFHGPHYRLYTICHQALFVPFLCKLYCATCNYLIKTFWPRT